MPSIKDHFQLGAEKLRSAGIGDAERDISLLVRLATGKDRTFLIAHDDYVLTQLEERSLESMLERRSARVPLQHIRGTQEFFGREFIVNSDVLIPRPETETLVEEAIAFLRNARGERFCEIGVGSGCIAVSILCEVINVSAVAGDISEAALAIAQINAEKHGVTDRLELITSDVFGSVAKETFDLIVSNPPYIATSEIEHLQPEVRDHDPRMALTDEADGLSIISVLIRDAPTYLRPGGRLMIEIGWDQSVAVDQLIDRQVWREPIFLSDLQGIPRVLSVDLLENCPRN